MSFIKSFDTISIIVDEARERFHNLWSLNEDKMASIKSYCRDIDILIQDFDCESIEVRVDEDTMDLIVTIDFFDMTLERGTSNAFMGVIDNVKSFSFRSDKEDTVSLSFVYDGMWKRK